MERRERKEIENASSNDSIPLQIPNLPSSISLNFVHFDKLLVTLNHISLMAPSHKTYHISEHFLAHEYT